MADNAMLVLSNTIVRNNSTTGDYNSATDTAEDFR